MAEAKSERLINLLLMLLSARTPVTRNRIRQVRYPDLGEAAFDKAFERDKEELRALGVPVEVAPIDAYFDDEVGYRVRPERLAIDPVTFTPAEATVVGLAARLWGEATMSGAATAGSLKLRSAGVVHEQEGAGLEGLGDPLVAGAGRIGASEAAFGTLLPAVLERQAVTFEYRKSPAVDARRRQVQPWALSRYAGRWYLLAFDTEVEERRLFRLSRIVGQVRTRGRTGAYVIPDDLEVSGVKVRPDATPEPTVASVLLREGAAPGLRAMATAVESGVPGPDGDPWDRVHLAADLYWLADTVLRLGDRAVAESPRELRDDVIRRLQSAARA